MDYDPKQIDQNSKITFHLLSKLKKKLFTNISPTFTDHKIKTQTKTISLSLRIYW